MAGWKCVNSVTITNETVTGGGFQVQKAQRPRQSRVNAIKKEASLMANLLIFMAEPEFNILFNTMIFQRI